MSQSAARPVSAATSASPMIPAKGAGAVRIWLLVIAAMVYGMILVGGATRLTDSGLSITEWKPLLGAIPPMNDADWALAFEKYQTMTAQFHQLNPDMGMAGFQSIYWWEWGHRQLGRVIGVVFFIPLVVFWATGRTTKALRPHLLALFALGGLQGLIGWWMVASGVNSDLTTVAPYRLMTHFGLALFIIAYCFWLWLELGARRPATPAKAFGWASALLWLTGIQMLLGALVAGLDAGRGYTDWPMMGGVFVPKAIWALEPWWRNIFENEATTQFLHRMTAYGLFAVSLAAVWRFRSEKGLGFNLTAGLLTAQVVLGIATLMRAAPLDMALTHQGLGVLVVLSAVRLAWRTLPPRSSVAQAPAPAAVAAE